jgi:glycerol-3-phosphate dehydrogenase
VGRMATLSFGDTVDLMIVGGGINGTGIARDAAGRGLSVILCEQDDLASATSSASSKLIHGGLRYLEHYEFRLVREALSERETLLTNAPHIIRPLQFVLPHDPKTRPAWFVRAGLFLYDHLGNRGRLPGSSAIDLRSTPAGAPLCDEFHRGFTYADCWVDDARLVVLNACDAADHGARILTRTRCLGARRESGLWVVTMRDQATGRECEIQARILVNAAGPWTDPVYDAATGSQHIPALRLVKGSHIVVERRYEGDHAYILQNSDGRVVFALPFEGRFTLIGTTDSFFEGDPSQVRIDDDEVVYLCDAFNRFFADPLLPADVVWSYAGVRPLYGDEPEDPSKLSRDYTLDLNCGNGHEAPLLSVLGGKITTYRRLAEQVMTMLAPFVPQASGAWTATTPLPGGDIPDGDVDRFAEELRQGRPWLTIDLAARLARSYGTRAETLLGDADSAADLGHDFGAGLHEREVAYLTRHEWAETAQDILWRRSKLGLHMSASAQAELEQWLTDHPSGHQTSTLQ